MLQNQHFATARSSSRIAAAALLTTLVLVGLGVAGLRGPTGAARADEPSPETKSATVATLDANDGLLPAFDNSYLPADTIAVASFKPLRLAHSAVGIEPVLLSFPMSFGFAFATTDNGVDEVKTIVLSALPNQAASSPDPKDPALVEIYRMRKPYERSKLRVRIFGEAPDGVTETTCHGHACFRARSDYTGRLVNYLMVDDRTIVIVRDRDVPRVLASDPQSHPSWYGKWRTIADSPMATAFDSAAVAATQGPPADAQEEFFLSILQQTAFVFGHADATAGELKISATARCGSSETAAATMHVIKAGVAGMVTALTEPPQIFEASMIPKEFQSLDVAGTLVRTLSNLKMNLRESEVQVEAKFDAGVVAQFAEATKALLARQSEENEAREKQDEQAHIAKLGRLAEAFNAYHAAHGHYPPAAVVGPDGKTLHSWRVELLPYLGEKKLFDQYNVGEPWDSEHNKPLVPKIPSIFSTSQWSDNGDADYFVVAGKGTLFDPNAVAQRETVTDAPGETILVLQSRQRVPWTKPIDIETSADHDAVRPFRGHGKGFYAAFADGTVKFVPKATDAATVRAMFTKAGRDEVKLR